MGFTDFIFQDWQVNRGNTKGRFLVFLFRVANFSKYNRLYSFLNIPYRVFYKFFVEWVLGVDLPWSTKVGKKLQNLSWTGIGYQL